jgi:hypothetical protein
MHRFITISEPTRAARCIATTAIASIVALSGVRSFAEEAAAPTAPPDVAAAPASEAPVATTPAAPAEAQKRAAPAKDGENASKFNPLLLANNPKAHAYANELRAPVVIELGIAKRVAKLSPEQLTASTAVAQDALFAAASDYAVLNGKMAGGRYYPPPYNPETSEDVVKPVIDRVRKALAAAMTPEQRAAYEKGIAQQDKFYRDACLESLVSRLDIFLVLDEKQREQIHAALDKGWQQKWEETGAMQGIHWESFPDVPSSLLAPYLDKEQLRAWESHHKDSWYSRQMVLGGDNKMPADIPWDAERHR